MTDKTDTAEKKLDATVSNAPAKPDNLSTSSLQEMQTLSQQGQLNTVLDGKTPLIPDTLVAEDSLVIPHLETANDVQTSLSDKPNVAIEQPTEKQPKPHEGKPHTEKYANGTSAELDKNGHLTKLTYANEQGYNYEWVKDQLVSIDSFDKSGNVKPWLEKNNDGTWTQFDEKQDQIWNSDLSVNSRGDLTWTHKTGDVEIHRTDGSHTTISKAQHSWTTKYPDGEERKIVYDEKTNSPCEYWAPKPHSSHWKSSDGLTWHQIGKDGKPLSKKPMIGKFITDDESGGFSFVNLGEKNNPHITAYDSTGASVKQNPHDTAANMVAGMVERYATKRSIGGKVIPQEQFEKDSKDGSLSVDDRIAARVLQKLVEDYRASNVKDNVASAGDIVSAFIDLVNQAESGNTTVNEHIYQAMRPEEEEEAKEKRDIS